jgi:HD-GYP domain-containing protein (c-di-GMP phosphodiesterase class II)
MGENSNTLTFDGLIPIDIRFLEVGSVLTFPLYRRVERENGEDEFILLANRDQKLTNQVRLQVQAGSAAQVFTKSKYVAEYNEYLQYLESHTSEILTDQSIPLKKRSNILYSLASKTMEDLFVNGISKESFDKAVGCAEYVSEFLASNNGALNTLMTLTTKDYKLFTHAVHVCLLGLSLYHQTLFRERPDLVSDVAVGLLFHDIGKSRINESILKKTGMLTPTEWKIMRNHPIWGCEILRQNGVRNATTLEIVRYHHERLDGQGYPEGLRGHGIPYVAQIGAIADCFAAMTCNRPHNLRVNAYSTLQQMMEENQDGSWLDPDLLEAFIVMLGE